VSKYISQRHSAAQKLRWSVLAVLICTLITYFARLATSPISDGPEVLNVTLFGSIFASLLGVFFLRSLSDYPGVQGVVYIVPSFIFGYGIAFFVFLFARLNYSRSVFIANLLLCIIWFFLVHFRAQRRGELSIGIVPTGAALQLSKINSVGWRVLDDPDSDASDLTAIVADLRSDLPDAWERRLTDYALEGLPVYHSKQLMESLTGQVELEHLSENSFGGLAPVSAYMTIKHTIDWIFAAIVLVILSPILIALAIAIRLDSPGPAIFRQKRIGYRGRPFTVYKFRSMTPREAPEDNRAQAMTQANDQRVTRIGRFLRTSRIDELPQLLNVLKGEMSWIGPRPEAEVLSRWYETEIPFYRYRHIVLPGITGWAQVSQGHVAEVNDVRLKLHYDFYYIKHFSPWLDLLIVARTINTMLTGFGAR